MLELTVLHGKREVVLRFEHSLLSLSKWESKHKKPFGSLSSQDPSAFIDYFQDMLLPPETDPKLVIALSPMQMEQLADYINDVPSAVKLPEERSRPFAKAITNEHIYAQMVMLKIQFHPAETWHVNRLMILIREISLMHEPAKKRPDSEILTDWAAENARRLEKHNTTG